MRHRALFALALGAAALLAGCDSLPDFVPRIDLSGFFDGNHPAVTPAQSLDVTQTQPDLTLRFHGIVLKDSTVDAGSNEITLHFDEKADASVIADIQHSAPDWIEGAQANGDTATIVAKRDVNFSPIPTADGFILVLKPNQIASAPDATPIKPVETDALRGDLTAEDDGTIDGLQREDLRGAFGVDGKTEALLGSL